MLHDVTGAYQAYRKIPKISPGASLLLRRFVFRMAEASAKRVTGDEPQGTMGRGQTAGEATSGRHYSGAPRAREARAWVEAHC